MGIRLAHRSPDGVTVPGDGPRLQQQQRRPRCAVSPYLPARSAAGDGVSYRAARLDRLSRPMARRDTLTARMELEGAIIPPLLDRLTQDEDETRRKPAGGS